MNSNRPTRIIAICSYGPSQLAQAREALDAFLAAAIFEQKLTLLFCGEGVWQLMKSQQDFTGNGKALIHSLEALPLYGVDAIYADAESLRERGLDTNDLLEAAQAIDVEMARSLLRQSDSLMSF